MSAYHALHNTSTSPLFKHLVDLSITFLNTNHFSSGLAGNISAVYQTPNHTVFAPTDAALFAFAQSVGYAGSNQSAAMSHLLNQLQLETPGSGQGVADFMAGFLIQGIAPLGALTGVTLLDVNGQPSNLSVTGGVISDGDAESPDANGGLEVLNSGSFVIVTDQVVIESPISFNGPTATQGTSGVDNITGTSADEFYQLLGGEDYMNGKQGNDIIEGGDGNDRLRGGSGDDEVYGGADNDRLWGGTGNDIVQGGAGIDTLDGGKDDDIMDGGANNDLVKGGEGNDIVRGGSGADLLHGNKGDDQLFGDAGNDTLVDAQGNSTLTGGIGNDFLKGGVGNDTFVFETGDGNDRIRDFGVGDDLIDVTDFGFVGIGALTLIQQGNATLIDMGTGDTVLLDDTLVASLDGSDFLF